MSIKPDFSKCSTVDCSILSIIIAIILIIGIIIFNIYLYKYIINSAKKRYNIQSNIKKL